MRMNNLIKDVLKESLEDRVKNITRIIKERVSGGMCEQCGSELQEGECMECGAMSESSRKQTCEQCGSEMREGECMECGSMKEEFYEEDNTSACQSYKYHMENFGEDDERTIRFKEKCEEEDDNSEGELGERLVGKQYKLDVAKPKGKLTSADFKKLREQSDRNSSHGENWGQVAKTAAAAAVPILADYFGEKIKSRSKSRNKGSNKNNAPSSEEKEKMLKLMSDLIKKELESKQGLNESWGAVAKTAAMAIVPILSDFFYDKIKSKSKSKGEDIDPDDIKISPEEKEKMLRHMSELIKKELESKSEMKESWGAVARAAIPMAASYIGSKMGSDEEMFEDYYSDEYDSAEEQSRKTPTYVGHGLKDNKRKADRINRMLSDFDDDTVYELEIDEQEDELGEELKGKQHKLDVAEPKGKLTSADFKKLRQSKSSKTNTKDSKVKMNESEMIKFISSVVKDYQKQSKVVLKENELIDLVESIVLEEKEKKVLDRKKPKGYTEYEKNVKLSKKENDDYIKSVTKKMTDYLKGASKGSYEVDPKHFPKGNGQLEKMKKKAYVPSEAVEEFIEEFAYSPGMENLKYDEIKPNDEWIEMNIKGDPKTGNSSKYANAEETELGEKINEKRKKNLYGKEKEGSYKRVKQPVDTAGEHKGEKNLKNMFKKLGENETSKQDKLLNEEISKISDFMNYSRKTQ